AHVDNDPESFIPGLEGSGVVVAVGKGILPRLWLGKRVACSAHYPSSGTWAQYMVTPAGSCFPLSNQISDEQGSMSLVNPMTALSFFAIVKEGGHKALINNAAASALGRMVELIGTRKGISVINLVRSQKQLDSLKSTGSSYVLNTSDPEFIEQFSDLSKKLQATILFDSVCGSNLGRMAEVLPAGSSVIIYGNLSGAEEISVNPRCLIDSDIKISGFFLGSKASENGLIKNMISLLKVGHLMQKDLKIQIRQKFPLENAQEAVSSYMADMSAGKMLLVPRH
ncbi:MAG TPA: zinc-binding dehydrogenase, partial [Bacteroidales bacterium]|nr:zinc-binding dehydrogenase [Bacteroidales bacterium]